VDNVAELDFYRRSPRLKNGDGGGTLDAMEARVAKLESDLSFVRADMAEIKKDVRELRSEARTDFRLLFGAIIATALGVAGLMAKGFGWL